MNYLLFLNMGTPEIIILLIALGFPLILAVYCLSDIMRSSFQDSTNKVIWAVIVLLAPVIGSMAYLIWGRGQKTSAS